MTINLNQTTIAAETGHNTSANPNYNQATFPANFKATTWITNAGVTLALDQSKTDGSLNPVAPGHASHVSVKTLIPAYTGKWYTWVQPWFQAGGAGSHIDNGTDWASGTYVLAALNDIKSRGIDGVVLDWYGQAMFENTAALVVKAQIAAMSGLTYAISINTGDFGVSYGYGTTAQLEAQLTYIKNTYFGTPNYMTIGGKPVVFLWGVPVAGVDYNAAKASVGVAMYWFNQGPPQLANAWCDAVYDWNQPWSTGVPADRYNAAAANSFLSNTHSTAKGVMPAITPGFNDKGLATWGQGRYIPRDNGKCWLSQAAVVAANLPTNTVGMFIVTWNDYEEGHEIELGIDNNITVTASMSGTNLVWSVSGGTGDESTIDSYNILASANGVDAGIVATQATGGSKSVDMSILNEVGSGVPLSLYVVAVGKASIRTHASTPVSFTTAVSSSSVISIVHRTLFTKSGTTSPQTVTIPATIAGDTLLVMLLNPKGSAVGAPKLGGTNLTLSCSQNGSSIAVLANINAGETVVTFPTVPLSAVIYELSPCTPNFASQASVTPSSSESGIQVSEATNAAYFEVITQDSSVFGGYVSVTAPWTMDYVLGGIYVLNGTAIGSVALLLNVTGPAVPVWSVGEPGGNCGVCAITLLGSVLAPAVPTGSISANPDTIQHGQASVLSWNTTNAVSVSISGIGAVGASGAISVTPAGSTTYVLTVVGIEDTVSASALVTVLTPCSVLDGQGDLASLSLEDLSLNIAVATQLYKSYVDPSAIQLARYNTEGRSEIVLDFNNGDGLFSRDLGTVFTWSLQADNIVRIWQPSILAMPENTFNRPGEWDNGGYPGAKFIQGAVVDAESFGNNKTFALQSSDDGSLHTLLETPVSFDRRTEIAFSCVPFVAHGVRLVSTDDVAWRVWGSKLVFQPYPELTKNWTTPMTSLGLTGWGHIREMNIAYISTADLVLNLSFDMWPSIAITIPNSGGAMQKVKFPIPANKFKLVKPSLTSSEPFRLFAPDLEVKLGQWGRTDPYTVVKPFGGQNGVGAEV